MSNRMYKPGIFSFEKNLTMIDGEFTVGSSGAVSSYLGSGVTSVTKTASAGSYTITLDDGFPFLCGASFCVLSSAVGTVSAIDHIELAGAASYINASTPYITIQTTLNNALANATSGVKVRFMLYFRNSSLTGKGE